ncbi:adaptin N terminal region-domain-containing protein [Endogone sp. FLAS-F59071]|nr:adaptin N terminal region-domain-containing protein [Endogone sp. FLAS-F59071]|eukprot:RUS21844.1 adaptin N terminal region-domain-containing protein [Endogone sp. FLAS-F59071]
MFEKSLTDLIRGIRANKKNDQKYIAACLQEIRQEIKSNDPDIKAIAIAKLTYVRTTPRPPVRCKRHVHLQMLGYDMSWASFHIVEVMSSPKFLAKRSGYLAAAQTFQQDTDVLMLTTNLIKKDLGSSNPLDIGITINGLSHILTPDLARDLCQDLVSMLNHSRPYIRKKVVLVLYKVFLKFPEGLRLSFPRLKERLEDPDPSVISAAVNVICELARKKPENYLSLAPQLFKILTTSTNNWMLIKIIKLFGALTPLEPRLAKKLLPPITNLIQTTPAMSLLYECIYTVITGGFLDATTASDPTQATALAAMCVNKLRTFLEDQDQNLKYIGLLALGKILPTHPKLVAEHKDLILECIDDPDISIRIRALDLIVGMVNRKNLVDIVKRLMTHLVPPSADDSDDHTPTTTYPPPSTMLDPAYRSDIIYRIVHVCSQAQYANVTNFEWYVAVLVDLTYVAGVSVGELLTGQIMDVGVRVKSVRPYAVKMMVVSHIVRRQVPRHRHSPRLQYRSPLRRSVDLRRILQVGRRSITWISCPTYLQNIPAALEFMLQPGVTKLQPTAQAVFVHNILKIYAHWAGTLAGQWDDEVQTEFVKVTGLLREKLGTWCRSVDLEVQERACNAREILTVTLTILSSHPASSGSPAILSALPALFFAYELNPVAPKAQKKVPVPEGLDLDAWINDPLPESGEESEAEDVSFGHVYETEETPRRRGKGRKKGRKAKGELDSEEEDERKERRRAERLQRIKHDPFYIADRPAKASTASLSRQDDFDVDLIPIVKLTIDDVGPGKLGTPLLFTFRQSSCTTHLTLHPVVASKKLEIKDSKKKKSSRKAREPSPPAPIIYAEEEMPEGAAMSASDDEVGPGGKKRVSVSGPAGGRKTQGKGILDADYSGLLSVDLSKPLEENEVEITTNRGIHESRGAAAPGGGAGETTKERGGRVCQGGEEVILIRWLFGRQERKPKTVKEVKKKKEAGAMAESEKPKKPKKAKEEAAKELVVEEKEKKTKKKKKQSKEVAETPLVDTILAPTLVTANVPDVPQENGHETFEPFMSDARALYEDDVVTVTYTLALSALPASTQESPSASPVVRLVLSVTNKAASSLVSGVRFHFTQSFDVQQWLADGAIADDAAGEGLQIVGEISTEETREGVAEFTVVGNPRIGLCLRGDVEFDVKATDDLLATSRQTSFEIPIPASIFMLPIPRLEPSIFASLLADSIADFSYQGAALFPIRQHPGQSAEQALTTALETVTHATRTHVVEIVPGAASLYGRSWQGYQVAGLVKYVVEAVGVEEEGAQRTTMNVVLKCTDEDFVRGLVKEVEVAVGV